MVQVVIKALVGVPSPAGAAYVVTELVTDAQRKPRTGADDRRGGCPETQA